MRNNHYQSEHLRRSSLNQEMKQSFETWVRRLRSIASPEDSLISLCGFKRRGDRRIELTTQGSYLQRQSDDEGRWQDDGGESG